MEVSMREARDLVGQCHGQRIHRRLGRAVRAHERRKAAPGGGAADPQHQPRLLLAEIRQHCAVHPLGAEHIGVEHLRDLLGGERLGRTDHEVARVLHHHVEMALLPNDGRRGRIGGRSREHVEFERMQLKPLGRGQCAQLGGAAVVSPGDVAHRCIDDVARFGEGLGGELADAGAGAGDEDDGLHGGKALG